MTYATTVMSRALGFVAFVVLHCACSSSGNGPTVPDLGGDAGHDARSGPPEVPQASVTSRIGPGASGAARCSTNVPVVWAIGPSPVKDGDLQNGAGVSVGCKVAGNASSGFDVAATATLAGKGTVSITGHFTGGTEPQSGVTGKFIDATGLGSFGENDCVVTFAGGSQGIASGRIWGVLTCPNETDAKNGSVCEGEAEARFENCAE